MDDYNAYYEGLTEEAAEQLAEDMCLDQKLLYIRRNGDYYKEDNND